MPVFLELEAWTFLLGPSCIEGQVGDGRLIFIVDVATSSLYRAVCLKMRLFGVVWTQPHF